MNPRIGQRIDTIGAIPWSIHGFTARGKTGMVWLLNNFCSILPLLVWITVSFPLLVWVIVSGLRVISPCVSLTVAVFDSWYLASLFVKFFTASTSLSDLSSFSLVNIALAFSLCILDAWLNVSAVTLLASTVDSSYMNLRISYGGGDTLLWLHIFLINAL